MESIQIMLILLYMFGSIIAILFSIFGLYGIILTIYKLKYHFFQDEVNTANLPTISIIIPTYNEGSFIRKKIVNLLETSYPKDKIEYIFSDESNDETPSIIREFLVSDPRIRLLTSAERLGYSKAVFNGIQAAKNDIIIFTDAGALYDKDTIKELIKGFQTPKIGGVTGTAVLLTSDSLARQSEQSYRKFYNFMRKGESVLDSTFHFHGEASAVRRILLADLKKDILPSTNLDIFIALYIRSKGFYVKYQSTAKFYEYAPEKFAERTLQKRTRARGVINVLLHFKRFFLNPKYGKFGLIVYPAHVGMMIITPILILLAFILPWIILLLNPAIGLSILSIYFLGFIFGMLFLRNLTYNVIQIEIVLLQTIAISLVKRDKPIFIKSIASTRNSSQ